MSGPVTSVVAAEASVHKGHIPMPPGPGPPPISAKSGPARGTDPGGSRRRGEGGGERPEAQHPRGASRREGRSSDSSHFALSGTGNFLFVSSKSRAGENGQTGAAGPWRDSRDCQGRSAGSSLFWKARHRALRSSCVSSPCLPRVDSGKLPSWSSDGSQLRCHLVWTERLGRPLFFTVTASVPPSRLLAAWRPFPRVPRGLRPAHRLAPCCIAGTQHVPAAGSERLPNGLCQAGNLASLFRKRFDWSFTPKHSLRQGSRSGSSLGKEAGARGLWGRARGAGQVRRSVLGCSMLPATEGDD